METKVQNFKVFESETGTPGPVPTNTKEWLGNQIEFWRSVEKETTDPHIQQKATDKINAISLILDTSN